MRKFTLLLLFMATSLGLIITTTSFTNGTDGEKQIRDNTPGTVTFTVKTVSTGGTYSPKHVLAIWVEKDGEFVKTRKAMANQRKQYLYTWRAASNYNVIDAITGATLTSHTTHTIEWDCTDLNGNVVVDGNYTMIIEFTDKHAQGPLLSIDFNKGTEPVSITQANQQYFQNISLTYEPEAVMLADFSANVQEACTDETIIFTDNSTGATSWLWNFGAGANPPTATTQGPINVTYSTSGSKTVELTINGTVTETKPDYITVTPDAVAGYTWTEENMSVSFTNISQNASSYVWDFGDGNTGSETNPVHTYAEPGDYNVSLTALSSTCSDDVYSELIVINAVAVAEFGADVTEACTGENIVFTDNSSGATTWEWSFGEGATPQSANTQGPHSVSYSSQGSKTITLTINGSVTITKTDFITIHPVAVSGFNFEQIGSTINFSNTSQNAVSYVWDFGDGNSSTEMNPTHTYTENGEYTVSLTAVSGSCGEDIYTQMVVITTVGVNEIVSQLVPRVYPNPSNGIFHIISAQKLNNASVEIFNIQGKSLYTESFDVIDANTSITLGEDSFNPGMYYLEISSDQGRFINKLLVK